jgi:glycosyltransferase involved in cell wall biosynthesis
VAPDVDIPSYRGASTHVLELSRALVQLGDDVHVICRRRGSESSSETISGVVLHRIYRGILGPLADSEAKPGVDTERLGLIGALYNLYLRSVFVFFAGVVALNVAKSNDLQVIVERETAFGAGALASLLSGRPMVLEVIGPRTSIASTHLSRIVLAYSKEMVPHRVHGKTVLVKAAVNTTIFKPDPEEGMRIRRRLGITSSRVVGYVGTFQSWHGLDCLLKAASSLKDNYPDVKYMLVGPIPSRLATSVEPRLSESLIFTGAVPYESVPKYINAFDIAVAPYCVLNTPRSKKGIGSPLKVLEYMACGRPTVASSLPQVSEIIEDGRTGLLFPQGDWRALSSKLSILLENPNLARMLGENAYEVAKKDYSWLSFAHKLQELIREIFPGNELR